MPSAVNRRRNVISTRSPICTASGVHVGELDREAAAAVEVDDGEHDRRARRVRELVDRERDDRGRARRPSARLPCRRSRHRPSTRAPAGGAARRSRGRASRRTPNFQSSERPAADADTRAGSGRRGGSTVTMPAPGEELAVRQVAAALDLRGDRAGGTGVRGERVGRAEQEHVGAVGEHDERDAPRRARPARARSSSSRPGCAVPVLPTVAARSSTTAPSRSTEPLGQRRAPRGRAGR